jgi:hypothetical protein
LQSLDDRHGKNLSQQIGFSEIIYSYGRSVHIKQNDPSVVTHTVLESGNMIKSSVNFNQATELMMRILRGIGFNIFNPTWTPTWWTGLIYVNWVLMFIRIFHHILTNDVTMIETTEATSMACELNHILVFLELGLGSLPVTASQILLKYLVMMMNKTGFRKLLENVETY